MKKILLSLILLFSILSSATAEDEVKPYWVDEIDFAGLQEEHPGNYVIGVGSAEFSTKQLSKQSAEVRAKAEISEVIESQLRNLILDFLHEPGNETQQALAYFEQDIIWQIDAALSNVEILDTWESEDGEFYVLAGCKAGDAIDGFKRIIEAEKARSEFYENSSNQDAAFIYYDDSNPPDIKNESEEFNRLLEAEKQREAFYAGLERQRELGLR